MLATAITPKPTESQAEFAVRFHNVMAHQIPDTDERTRQCFSAWRHYRGDDRIPALDETEFDLVRDVPVFTEHTTRDRNGNLVVYDRRALAAIADRCNHRIKDTGNVPPLTEGHTPDHEDLARGAKMPEVLGYAGRFRLGMIGKENPRWAIFADEWHHKEDAHKFKKMRRRSPEVWLEDRMEDRFFDPIAVLGAETPRLDMGMARFSWATASGGRRVEKYSSVAVGPSATSTFVPSDDEWRQQDYAAAERTPLMLTPEDVSQVVDALMETEPMQWVVSQMGGGEAAGGAPQDMQPPEDLAAAAPPEALPGPDQPGGEAEQMMGGPQASEPAPPAAPAPGAEPAPAPMPEDPNKPQAYCADEDDDDKIAAYMAGDVDDEEMMEYMAHKKASYQADGNVEEGDPGKLASGDGDIVEGQAAHYSRQRAIRSERARYKRLQQEHSQLQQRVARIEREKKTADRYSRLSDLSREYALDLEAEVSRCDPARMSDDLFDDHLDVIVENYQRLPVGIPGVYAPPLPKGGKDDGRPSADQTARAQKYCLSQRDQGIEITYGEALEHVMGHGAA